MPRTGCIACLIAALFGGSSAWAQNAAAGAEAGPAAVTSNLFALEASTGVDYSTGKYGGTTDTRVFGVPFGIKLQYDRLRVEGSIPYLDIKGVGVSAGDGTVVKKQGSNTVTSTSGIGDLTIAGGWTVLRESEADPFPGVELAGAIKLPTAASGLGTGKTDFTAQANLFHTLSADFLLFGSLGYQWLGSSLTFPLKSGVRATAGLNYKPQDNVAAGAVLDYRQSYETGLPDYFALDPYLLWRFAADWGVSAYAVIGLSNASPSWGSGFRVIFYQ